MIATAMSRNQAHMVALAAMLALSHLAASAAAGMNSPTTADTIQAAVSTVKDIVNLLFFLVVGTIAVLSYLQARKTLFTPIKTETFKLQLKVFEELLFYFEKREQEHLDDTFDFKKILDLNAAALMDDYVRAFFSKEMEVDEEERQKFYADFVGAVITKDFLFEHFRRVDWKVQREKKEAEPEVTNPYMILSKWQKYRYGCVRFTAKYSENLSKIRRFRSSPLIPEKLRDLLREVEETVHRNLTLVGDVLTDAAKELPENYPDVEVVMKADVGWIWNKYNDRFTRLEELQDRILAFINEYLQVDDLLR